MSISHFAELKSAEGSEIEANGYFSEPEWREVISPDGVKCFVTKFSAPKKSITAERIALPDDPSIPAFLRRQS